MVNLITADEARSRKAIINDKIVSECFAAINGFVSDDFTSGQIVLDKDFWEGVSPELHHVIVEALKKAGYEVSDGDRDRLYIRW